MKLHVVLKRAVAADPTARQAICDRLIALGMTGINQPRFEQYGIVSGDISEERLDALQNIEGIHALQRDGTMRGSTPSRRPELGPDPTEGDDFFHRLSDGAKRAYE